MEHPFVGRGHRLHARTHARRHARTQPCAHSLTTTRQAVPHLSAAPPSSKPPLPLVPPVKLQTNVCYSLPSLPFFLPLPHCPNTMPSHSPSRWAYNTSPVCTLAISHTLYHNTLTCIHSSLTHTLACLWILSQAHSRRLWHHASPVLLLGLCSYMAWLLLAPPSACRSRSLTLSTCQHDPQQHTQHPHHTSERLADTSTCTDSDVFIFYVPSILLHLWGAVSRGGGLPPSHQQQRRGRRRYVSCGRDQYHLERWKSCSVHLSRLACPIDHYLRPSILWFLDSILVQLWTPHPPPQIQHDNPSVRRWSPPSAFHLRASGISRTS